MHKYKKNKKDGSLRKKRDLIEDDVGVDDEDGGGRGAEAGGGGVAGGAGVGPAVDVISEVVLSHVLS